MRHKPHNIRVSLRETSPQTTENLSGQILMHDGVQVQFDLPCLHKTFAAAANGRLSVKPNESGNKIWTSPDSHAFEVEVRPETVDRWGLTNNMRDSIKGSGIRHGRASLGGAKLVMAQARQSEGL